MTIAIVCGGIANRYRYGGGAWVRQSWAEGLRRLGFDVYFVEQILPDRCVDAAGDICQFESSVNRAYFDEVMKEFGFDGRCSLLYGAGERSHGIPYGDLLQIADEAELLVNISGDVQLDDVKRRPRRTVYLDVDPGWSQIAAAGSDHGPRLGGHDHYFTIGENIGTSACSVDTGGVRWGHVRQPVVLDDWPVTYPTDPMRLTTIATLKGPGPFPRAEIRGSIDGLKSDELAKVIEIPRVAHQTFEIGLRLSRGWADQVEPLLRNGWCILDAATVSSSPGAFRQYVQGAGGEFSTARGVYVRPWTGWFSDRTVRFLASGRPAIVQDTGFSDHVPVGEGLLAFRDLDEAVVAAGRIESDYLRHARAARAVAEEYFASDVVLGRFLEQIDVSP